MLMARNLILFGLPLALARSDNGDDWTKVTSSLNALIAKGDNGVYTGGSGVLVRNPFDGYSDDTSKTVVPATLWVNDIYAVSQIYPGGDPRCPSTICGQDDPWRFAQTGFVIGSMMSNLMDDWDNVQDSTWGKGVFYPSDSNSVDKRCRWFPDNNVYDCPGGYIPWGGSWESSTDAKGTGIYDMGNPHGNDNYGGGAGCHVDAIGQHIDQLNGDNGQGRTLLSNAHCECNYGFKSLSDPNGMSSNGNGWGDWVDQFNTYVIQKWDGASYDLDLAACWVNNPRDMINIQNQIFWKRTSWASEKVPLADYFKLDNYDWTRRYWGWNEIPVTRTGVQDPGNWDAIVIMIPAFACNGQDWDNLDCFDDDQEASLDDNLDQYVQKGYLKVGLKAAGTRPGSSVVLARQSMDDSGNFGIYFFCQNWAGAWGGQYQIVYATPTAPDWDGGCWLDWKQGSTDMQTKKTRTNPVVANVSGAFGEATVMV